MRSVVAVNQFADRCHEIGQWVFLIGCSRVQEPVERMDRGVVVRRCADRPQGNMLFQRDEMPGQIDHGAVIDYGFHLSYSLCVNTWRMNSICRLKWIAATILNLLPPTSNTW